MPPTLAAPPASVALTIQPPRSPAHSGAAEAVLRTPPRPAAPYSGMARKVRELLLASLIDASLSALEPDASGPDLEAELSAPSLAEEGQHADRGRPQRRGSGGPGKHMHCFTVIN